MLTYMPNSYLYLLVALVICAAGILVYNRLTYFREKRITQKLQRLNAQLTLIMDANKTDVWTYNTRRDEFKVISNKNLTETLYTPLEFSQRYAREDFLLIQKAIESLQNREQITETLTAKNAANNDESLKYYEITLSVLHRNRKDMPIEILGTQRDITKEQKRAVANKNLMLRFHTVFNSSQVDMIYYNADGYLADLNDKACETFGVKDPQSLLKRKIKMTDIPSYREMDINKIEHTILSSITDITTTKTTDERLPEVTRHGKIYYEAMLSPIRDARNKLQGVMAAGRDITETVESNHRQKASERLLQQQAQELQRYVDDINYTLKISDARLANYYPATHTLEILKDLRGEGTHLSQLRAIDLIHPEHRSQARSLINKMDRLYDGNITATLRTQIKDETGRDIYLNFHLMPITDKDNHVDHYFGMFRNDTEMAHTEIRLQEETIKAHEDEQLKSAFMLNMSYELRIPLHAVIGFAELFNTEHSLEDEPIFAAEIKKNTDILLNLINDILFISRLDAHMIEYHYEACDIATTFDSWCQLGWSEAQPGVSKNIENAYHSMMVRIDRQNLGIAVQKLCAYTALTTKEGTLKARYEYLHDELFIIVEDTSPGINFSDVPNAFDRFVSTDKQKRIGTGLDLPIVKELVEQMGGTIDLLSERDKGSSFFISIPCQIITYNKKEVVWKS